MGIIPDLLTNPIVGLIPTIPLTAEGQTTEPSVSVPTATTHRFAAATADPLETMDYDLKYGFFVRLYLHPEQDCVERKFAHSLRFVSIMMAPASLSLSTTKASLEHLPRPANLQ
jgi:hypothetical protein